MSSTKDSAVVCIVDHLLYVLKKMKHTHTKPSTVQPGSKIYSESAKIDAGMPRKKKNILAEKVW